MSENIKEYYPKAAKIKSFDTAVQRDVRKIYAKFLKSFEKAMSDKYVKSSKSGYKNLVVLTHNNKSNSSRICPENVILSTAKTIAYDKDGSIGDRWDFKNIDKDTNVIYVFWNKKSTYSSTVVPVMIDKNIGSWITPVSTGYDIDVDKHDVVKTINDLIEAYQVVSKSVKFKDYLRDQLVNNVI
jgi:hypothetical protein